MGREGGIDGGKERSEELRLGEKEGRRKGTYCTYKCKCTCNVK